MRAWIDKYQNFIGGGLIVALLIANVFIHYNLLTRPYPGHNDFLTPWEATRGYFTEGIDPYSDAASVRIQERIYGRAALPDEFPNHYAYPFYAMYFVWPTIHVDYAWATAIWMVFSEALLIGALFLLFDIFDWKPKPITLLGLIAFTLFSYPGARGLLLGQVSHLVYFMQVLVLWLLLRGHNLGAGVVLALSTFKPQMGVLLVPFLLLYALVTRRWSFLSGFAVVFGLLVGSSFLLQPDWLNGMLYQVELYPSYVEVSTPVWVIAQYWLGLGDAGEWAINLAFYGLLLWAWYSVLVARREGRFLWVVMLTLVVTHLVAFRTATPHFIVFMIPLVFWLKHVRRKGLAFAALVVVFIVPWVHFLLTISPDGFEHPTVFIPLPLLTFALLWFTRRMWWQEQREEAVLGVAQQA